MEPDKHGYPAPRRRPPPAAAGAPLRYVSSEVLRLDAASAAAFVEVGRFSGQPDAIDLSSVVEAHRVRLLDRRGQIIGEYLVPAGETLSTYQTAEVVEALALAATANRVVAATGKWAAPDAPVGHAEPVPSAP